MSKQREALEMALEALIEVTGWQWAGPMRVMDEVEDAISAIREALAEPTRKPLTDEQIDALDLPPNGCTMRELVQAIEQAHGITE